MSNLYKDSPFGKIPSDWEVKELEKITEKIGDGLHGTPEYVSSSEYYFINGNNLKDGLVQINADTKCVSKEEYLKHKKELKYKTILLSINGTIGSIAFYKNENIVLGKSAAYINCKDENVDYLYYYLQSQSTTNFFEGELTGSTIRNLSLKSIRDIPVFLPPLPEQKAIAHILGLMDTAINKNNYLIAKKELQKKWLMQNLLTGKKRLLNDELGIINDELKTVKLGDLIKLSSGDTKPEETNGVVSDILTFPIYGGNGIMAYTNVFNSDNEKIIIGRVGEYCGITRKIVGKCWITDNALYTTEIKNDISIDYLTYKLQYEDLSKLRNIGGQPLVSQKPIYNLSLIIHNSIEEQTAIAQVLQAADKEIQLLKTKTEKLREQKKGLMQVLLTGKKRLFV